MDKLSETDVKLFSTLANPDSTRPVDTRAAAVSPRSCIPTPAADTRRSATSSDGEDDEGASAEEETDSDEERSKASSQRPSVFSDAVNRKSLAHLQGGLPHVPRGNSQGSASLGSRYPHIASAPPLRAEAYYATDTEETALQKQTALLELERLRASGVVLSKTYTMSDRLEDMEFEVKKHLIRIKAFAHIHPAHRSLDRGN